MPDSRANSSRLNPSGRKAARGLIMPSDRWIKGAWLFRDETLLRIAVLLDEAFRVPFTRIRFGIDGVIGLLPGLGDVIAGILSLVIPLAAWSRGIPYITILRMGVNLAIDVLVGSVPVLGDVFDIAWKANRRNYRLMQRHLGEPRRHTWKDWVFLLAFGCAMALVFAVPIVALAWLLLWINEHIII